VHHQLKLANYEYLPTPNLMAINIHPPAAAVGLVRSLTQRERVEFFERKNTKVGIRRRLHFDAEQHHRNQIQILKRVAL